MNELRFMTPPALEHQNSPSLLDTNFVIFDESRIERMMNGI